MSTVSGRPFELVVRGGTVVTPRRITTADVAIRDGRIVRVGRVGTAAAREVLDAHGALVLPGMVDAHTHLAWEKYPAGERTVDDYRFGTIGAAVGGVTTVANYVRTRPDRGLVASLRAHIAEAEAEAAVDVAFHLVPGEPDPALLDELPALVAAGVPGLKVFLNRASDAWLLAVLRAVGAVDGLAMLHCETAALVDEAYASLERAGTFDVRHWPQARPAASEVAAVERAIAFCRATGTRVYLVHLSVGASVAAVAAARRARLPVHAETRPGYLLQTDERYAAPDPVPLWVSGSPPLRDAAAVDAMWAGVRRRVIGTVASDHAAYTLDQKRRGEHDLRALPVGIPSLETQLGALYATGVGGGRIDLRTFVDLVATTPARLLGLAPRKGVVAPGSDADLVILDPSASVTVRAASLHGRAGYEPLEGRTFTGWPVATVARGEVMARDGDFVGRTGRGRFLPRSRPA